MFNPVLFSPAARRWYDSLDHDKRDLGGFWNHFRERIQAGDTPRSIRSKFVEQGWQEMDEFSLPFNDPWRSPWASFISDMLAQAEASLRPTRQRETAIA